MAHCTLFDRIYLFAMQALCHACSLALSTIRRPAPEHKGWKRRMCVRCRSASNRTCIRRMKT